jgi:undecaprenyl-diphosphatase
MGWIESIVLAVVQGLTEFLPVSSDGHLVLGGALLGDLPPGFLRFELVLHLGTLLAALLFYRRDLAAMAASLLPAPAGADPRGRADARRTALLVVVALLPTFVVVKALDAFFEGLHERPWAAVAGLAANGLRLLAAHRFAPRGDGRAAHAAWWQAAAIGLAQAAAPLPGVSRSGTTIVTGLLCGLGREEAVRFSFLLSIPTVGGAVLLKLLDGPAAAPGLAPGVLAAGCAAAAVTGWGAILLVLRWTRAGRLWQFGAYCLAVAAAGAALLAGR